MENKTVFWLGLGYGRSSYMVFFFFQNRFDAFVCDIYDSNYLDRTLAMSWISILSFRFLVFCTCDSVFRTWKSQEKRINIRIMETLFSVRHFIRTTKVRTDKAHRINNNSHTWKHSLSWWRLISCWNTLSWSPLMYCMLQKFYFTNFYACQSILMLEIVDWNSFPAYRSRYFL